jgi:alkylation response protein AidB-like acyl-CoA dehydrogenase
MISFDFTEDQRIAQEAAHQFAREEAGPAARAAEESAEFSNELLNRIWQLGIVQTAATGMSLEQPTVLNTLVLEEIAHGDAALAVALAGPLGFAKALAEGGTPAQREIYLPPFSVDSPQFAAIAHAETASLVGGSRKCTAHKVGNKWRVSGVKALVPLASLCKYFLITSETAKDGPQAFVINASAKGVRVGPAKGTLGLRALQMADVVFEDIVVSEDDRLPSSCIRRMIDLSRVALSAILTGLARAVYDYSLPYAKQRVVHGEAIGRKQAVAFKLADMHIESQAMRWLGLRAASELDAAPTSTRLARLAQRYSAERGLRIADEGVQVFGGHGFVRDLPLEMWYRNARTLSVLDGLIGV